MESHSKKKHCLQGFTVTRVLRSDSSLGHEVFAHHRAVWYSPAANAERTFRDSLISLVVHAVAFALLFAGLNQPHSADFEVRHPKVCSADYGIA